MKLLLLTFKGESLAEQVDGQGEALGFLVQGSVLSPGEAKGIEKGFETWKNKIFIVIIAKGMDSR